MPVSVIATAVAIYLGFKNNITADIELIKADQANEAFDRLEKGDVKYRFVLDLKTL